MTDPEVLAQLGTVLGHAMIEELHFERILVVEVAIALETCGLSEAQPVASGMMSRVEIRWEVLAVGGGERLTELTQEAVSARPSRILVAPGWLVTPARIALNCMRWWYLGQAKPSTAPQRRQDAVQQVASL